MNKVILLFIFTIFIHKLQAQVISVSGECMTGSIVLTQIPDIDGKKAYQGTGTVAGNTGTQVNVFWLPAPDNLWVLAFDGQPYFQNACNTSEPWGTGNGACPWSGVSGQACTGGTALSINVSGALPVTITDFTAKPNNKQVVLNWKTTSEHNNKGFEIQRSNDGVSWINVGFINGNNISSVEQVYQFNDLNPLSGNNVYRLRQVDLDGNFTYSSIEAVQFLKSGFYTFSRNISNNTYQLNIEPSAGKVDFYVFDAGGKKIISKSGATGIQYLDISKFPSGLYLLQIRKGPETFTEKLIKF